MTGWAAGLTRVGCGAYVHVLGWLVVYAVLATLAFGWKPIMIVGGSMGPGIDAGDLVLVERDVEHPLAVGSVVTYRGEAGRLVTHRITEALADGYRTRGDANRTDDTSTVPQSAVLGSGRLLIPFLGRPVLWARDGEAPRAALWLVATMGALVVAPRRLPVPTAPTRPEVRRLVGGQLVRVGETAGAGRPAPPRGSSRRLPPHLRVYRAPRFVWA